MVAASWLSVGSARLVILLAPKSTFAAAAANPLRGIFNLSSLASVILPSSIFTVVTASSANFCSVIPASVTLIEVPTKVAPAPSVTVIEVSSAVKSCPTMLLASKELHATFKPSAVVLSTSLAPPGAISIGKMVRSAMAILLTALSCNLFCPTEASANLLLRIEPLFI